MITQFQLYNENIFIKIMFLLFLISQHFIKWPYNEYAFKYEMYWLQAFRENMQLTYFNLGC